MDKGNLTTTKVIDIRGGQYDVYIGRTQHYKGELLKSYFGNPYSVHVYGRKGAIEKYEQYFRHRIDTEPEFKARVLELKGKVLGCWCKPLKCHGDVIMKWLEEQV